MEKYLVNIYSVIRQTDGVEYIVYKRLNPDYVEFLDNETKEVTFADIIDEPTEVSSLLVQSAVNEINNKQKHVRVWTSQFMY